MANGNLENGGPRLSFRDHDDYGFATNLDAEEPAQDDDLGENPLWDSFKCTEPLPRSGSMVDRRYYEILLQVIKVFLYAFLCIMIILGCVIAKSTVLFATSQISGRPIPFCENFPGRTSHEQHRYVATLPREARASWFWCVALMFAVPECLDFFRFLWNCFFVDFKIPKARYLGLHTVVEVAQAFGVAVMFLVVIPDLDAVQAAAALCCVCLVPSFLGILSWSKFRQEKQQPLMSLYEDIAAFLAQLGGLAALTYQAYQDDGKSLAPWALPIAFALCSLRYWGNYVTDYSKIGIISFLAKAQSNLQSHRSILIGYTSTIRITTFVLTSLWIAGMRGIDTRTFFDAFWMRDYNFVIDILGKSSNFSEVVSPASRQMLIVGDRWVPLIIYGVHAMATICVYNCGKFACKTLMHEIGFALPLNLSVPTTIGTLWLFCRQRAIDECTYHSVFPTLDYLFYNTQDVLGYIYTWQAWVCLIWYLSSMIVTRHTWTTKNERIASTEKIFGVPSYDSLIVDQSLAMSRWREEHEEDYADEYENIEEQSARPQKNSASPVRKDDHTTRIYTCATMWHETSEEMMDFLSSILRMDRDQYPMRFIKERYGVTCKDYYELEVHIFFDDAFKCIHNCHGRCTHDENKTLVNDWVVSFVEAVEESIKSRGLPRSPPIKYPTPYGGRLVWTLPEKTKMYVHLKDKNRIRTRKRWSQVMYMYYLLGYRLMELPIEVERKEVIARNTYILTLDGDIDFRPSAVRTLVDRMKINEDLGSVCGRIHPLGQGPMVWFQKFEYAIGHWLQKATEHTIGSVLCSPGCFALFRARALMDYNVMRKYATVPKEAQHFIQYDQGEDRWLCTLMLQMGYKVEYSAASDAYTHAPEGFNEFFIQRRRWIPSTVANIFDLLETAKETKKVNRDISWPYILYQWLLMGSTIVGPGTIFLMLVGAFVAAFRIDNWSSFGYNLIPIAIFCLVCFFCKEKTQLFVAGIITAIYGLTMIVVLIGIMIQIAEDGWLAPSTLFFFIVAGELVITGLLHPLESDCLIYGLVYYITVPSMYMLLIIFSLFNMNNISWGTRDVPKPAQTTEETKEDASKGSAKGVNGQAKKLTIANKKIESGPVEFSIAGLFKCIFCAQEQTREVDPEVKEVNATLARIETRLNEIERIADNGSRLGREPANNNNSSVTNNNLIIDDIERTFETDNAAAAAAAATVTVAATKSMNKTKEFTITSDADSDTEDDDEDGVEGDSDAANSLHGSDNFLVSPNWLHGKDLGKGEVEYLRSEEEVFWKQLIGTYLDPIDKDERREAEIAKQIKDLRDAYIFKFFMINALFVLTVFLMQLNKELLHFPWPLGVKYNVTYTSSTETDRQINITHENLQLEPIGCVFILCFISILCIQFVAMLIHRYETFAHIMAKVKLDCACWDKDMDLSEEAKNEKFAEKIVKDLQRRVENETTGMSNGGHNSTIPPSKRKTILQTIKRNNRRMSYTATLHSQLQSDFNGNGDLTSTSQRAVQALEKHRTLTILRRNSKVLGLAETDSPLVQRSQRQPTTYDNPAYEDDEATGVTMRM